MSSRLLADEQMQAAVNYITDKIVSGAVSEKELLRKIGRNIEAKDKKTIEIVINKYGRQPYYPSEDFLLWLQKQQQQQNITLEPSGRAYTSRETAGRYVADFGKAMLFERKLLPLVAAAQPYFALNPHDSVSLVADQLGMETNILMMEMNVKCAELTNTAGAGLAKLPLSQLLMAVIVYGDKLPTPLSSITTETAVAMISDSTYKRFGLHFLIPDHDKGLYFGHNEYTLASVNSLRYYIVVFDGFGEHVYYVDDMDANGWHSWYTGN